MSELFFTIKTKNENAVNAVLQKQKCVEFDGLNVLADYIELGQTVFIVFGGDKPQWETGLVGLGTIAKLPYGYEGRNFKVAVDMKVLFSKPIKRADLVLFPDTYDIIGIAPITKWEPNQALSQVETNKAYALLNAIFFIDNNAKNEFHNIFSADQMNRIKGKYRKFIVDDDSIESKTEQVLTETIEKPHNRIIFGAPGTGKSNKLKEDSEQFENQEPIESDEKDIIKQEIIEANELNDKLNRYIAIGFSHSEFLKDYTTKQIRETFEIENCEDNIYVGAKAKFYYDKYIEDNDDDETITKRINEAKAIKGDGMLQVLAGIGFRFSETLMDYTKEELKKEYPLDSRPQIYWVYRAVHGAKYIKTKKQEKIKYLERVTFHPNYSYAQFVGTYKPVQDTADETQIKYEYVPGPFMRIYTAAKKNTSQNFLLLIEEINRANVAAVFGDVFQLLDRDENGNSEYPVAASEDIKKYLAKNGIHEEELKIPSNMYIWATMNSADQGVFPMDTAFKRRWEFEYIGIDENELLGPFFLSKTVLDSALDKGMDFVKLFESKVLMYLFEDAAKMKAKQLFNVDERKFIYSEVCKKFEAEGLNVFKFNESDVVEELDIAIKKDDAPSDGRLF